MKLSRKGFMLVEVVVVSAVISAVLITMYIAVNRVSNAYSKRDNFNNIDALYLAMTENDALIRNGDLADFISDNETTSISNEELLSTYNKTNWDANLYFVPYKKSKVEEIKEINTKETMTEFVDYISNKLDFTVSKYNYMIVSEICKTEDDCYYYALKLKYE